MIILVFFIREDHRRISELREESLRKNEALKQKYRDLFWEMQTIRSEHPEYFL
jgi:hypothetical protein